jgi:hypothetical protein
LPEEKVGVRVILYNFNQIYTPQPWHAWWNFVLSLCLEGCDKAEIWSDVANFLAIFPMLKGKFLAIASQQSKY